jgi:hypothetical protein
MTADAIREAMARALCVSFYGTPWEGTSEFRRGICDNMADAALDALPISAAQMAEIAAGRAVVVPVEATDRMFMQNGDVEPSNRPKGARRMRVGDMAAAEVWRRMIAAAPREGEPC